MVASWGEVEKEVQLGDSEASGVSNHVSRTRDCGGASVADCVRAVLLFPVGLHCGWAVTRYLRYLKRALVKEPDVRSTHTIKTHGEQTI